MQRKASQPTLTPDRLSRLYRLVQLLGTGPKTRAVLVRRLRVDTRGFYRDFEKMREFGVAMELHDGRYVLLESVAQALARLPFPDPGLSVQEALQLSAGRSTAHRKLRGKIAELLGKAPQGSRKS
jgi:predicted DNA-binding transcriptional regulator YafY